MHARRPTFAAHRSASTSPYLRNTVGAVYAKLDRLKSFTHRKRTLGAGRSPLSKRLLIEAVGWWRTGGDVPLGVPHGVSVSALRLGESRNRELLRVRLAAAG